MKFYQDPDTGNCYAVGDHINMGLTNVDIPGPTTDARNARVNTYKVAPAMLICDMIEVDEDTVRRDHPRLLAYLDYPVSPADEAYE